MDAGDRDLGSSGLTILDPATFSGGSVSRMGVTVGKNGKAYVVNLDNLGGFKQGSANGDAAIQTITMPGGGSIFGGVGSYPLEGGEFPCTSHSPKDVFIDLRSDQGTST